MIPGRLLLRAATVLALTRGGDGPDYPTMAGENIFDSRVRPLSETEAEVSTPIGFVYTGDEKRHNLAAGAAGRPEWKRTISLTIELAMCSVGKDALAWKETDAELEAVLDLFELEVEAALCDLTNPWSVLWRRMVKRIDSWESEAYRSAEQSVRYAVRGLHIGVEINNDCMPQPTIDPVKVAKPAKLQIPYLQELADQIDRDPMFASTRRLISGANDLVQLPALKRVHFRTAEVDPVSVHVNLETKP